MSTNTEPIVLGAGDTVARRAIVEAISWAGAASAALDIDHRPEEAALVDEAIDALTRAYEAAGAPRPGSSS